MKIGIAQKQGYTQVDMAGVLGVDAVRIVREEMDHLLGANPSRVLWDLSKLGSATVDVFCEVLRALARIKLNGGSSVLLSPPGTFREYLGNLSVASVFPATDDVPTAIRMIAPAQTPRRSEFVEASLLGEILIDLGVLEEDGLKRALDEQRRLAGAEKLGSILLRLDIVTPAQILSALETQYQRRQQRSTGGSLMTPPSKSEFVRRNLLGQILQEAGMLDDTGLKRALEEQRRGGGREKLGDVLLRLKIVTPDQLLRALEKQARR